MKGAVTIPEELYKVTGTIARRLGISRTRLYEKALVDFANRQDNQIMNALNKMHGEESPREINPLIRAAAEQILTEELGPATEPVGADANPLPKPPSPSESTRPADKA